MMVIIFISCIFLVIYSYVVYPLILLVVSFLYRRQVAETDYLPTITLVISAFNEEKIIGRKIENSLELYYPRDKFEIVVALDKSTDSTEQIVLSYKKDGVQLLRQEVRRGKTACLNRVVPEVSGEIIVFTDANSMFPPELLNKLVRQFADTGIGLVTGWTKYRASSEAGETSGVYSRFEMWTKKLESRISSCVGADGAIFAMRKSLFQLLRDDDINDFVIPLRVIKQGKRVVMDPEVFCFEDPSRQVEAEYKRQVRITTRTLRAIMRNTEFLNPIQYGFFAFFLISHKILRFMVPFFLIFVFLTNVALLNKSPIYPVIFSAQLLFFLAAILSLRFIPRGKIQNLLKFFVMTSFAQLVAWFRVLKGESDTTWTPQR